MPRLDVVFIHDLSPDNEDMGEDRQKYSELALTGAMPELSKATQYSLLKHDDALNNLFPLAEQQDVSFVLGAPLNSGYLADSEYYNYSKDVPEEMRKKRDRYRKLAE